MNHAHWVQANRNLIAKALGELTYEEVLKAEPTGESTYRVQLKSGQSYVFAATQTIWGHLRVKPQSIVAESAGQFFIDAQADLEMTDIILANFLEEMHSTLYSDVQMLSQSAPTAESMTDWSADAIQKVLNGHPKILLNKGRMGWSASDLEHYAPESGASFQLHWLALHETSAVYGIAENSDRQSILRECMNELEMNRFLAFVKTAMPSIDQYFFVPVHPWQWNQKIQLQFASELASKNIISLGVFGDHYRPQISIRTLSNVSRPECNDIKLPVSILNTSAVRGIPSRYIAIAPAISSALSKLCREDPILKAAQTEVLEEQYGVSYVHPLYAQIKGVPYRYTEQLGAIARESLASKLGSGENAILTASFFYQDAEGQSLIGATIRKSGLTTEAWLKLYFESVVIPLYHLQVKYGIGLVAHGQNVILKLKNHAPCGMFLKDFQGDLRLSKDENIDQLRALGELVHQLDRLPTEYLIHDLVTGHFLTVLRFISAVLKESDQFAEAKFYGILSQVIQAYIRLPDTGNIQPSQDLLQKTFQRVLLNKVRFKIGYADSAERPLPMVGSVLVNPLATNLGDQS